MVFQWQTSLYNGRNDNDFVPKMLVDLVLDLHKGPEHPNFMINIKMIAYL